MDFYSNVATHIELVVKALGQDIGITIVDRMDLNLKGGKTQIAFTVGDIDPLGYNELGQEKQEIELELQFFVPASKEPKGNLSTQTYTAALAAKAISFLKGKHYGYAQQKETVQVEQNAAQPVSGSKAYEKGISFCTRSVVFRQVVYTGQPAIDEYSLEFELNEVRHGE